VGFKGSFAARPLERGTREVSSCKARGSRSLEPPTIGEAHFSELLRSERELHVRAIIKAPEHPFRGAAVRGL